MENPLHGTLGAINQTTGGINYKPDLGFTGNDKFTFIVNDGEIDSKNIGTVTITVTKESTNYGGETNHVPVAISQSIVVNMNNPIDIILTASDLDVNDNLTASIVTFPKHGNLSSINQNTGILTYSPNSNFVGNDSFMYTVSDGKAISTSAPVSIRVVPR